MMMIDVVEATVFTQLVLKGGTAKSTATREIATALGKYFNQRVLVVDFDDSYSLTLALGVDPEKISPNIYDVFAKNTPLSTVIQPTEFGFDFVAGHTLLGAVERASEEGKDDALLKEHLRDVLPDYDFVLIDPPPAKSLMLTRLILYASDQVIIPLKCQRAGFNGVSETLNHIQYNVWRDLNKNLRIFGIFPTIYRRIGTHSAGILQRAKELWGDKVLPFTIPDTDLFANADDEAMPALIWQPNHEAVQPYIQLAELIVQRLGKPNKEASHEVA
jgi:chromosome partitioning protein